MKKTIKNLTLAALTVLSLALVGCGGNDNDEMTEETPIEQTENTAVNDYEKYLVDRYNTYFNNEEIMKQYQVYDIYNDNFAYPGTYDEFIVGYNDFYANEQANLVAFKKDIETNYKSGDPEVDKLNERVMTSIDNSIMSMDEYGKTFAENTKDYGTLSNDEVVKGLRDIGKVPHEARLELNKLVEDAKTRLGID